MNEWKATRWERPIGNGSKLEVTRQSENKFRWEANDADRRQIAAGPAPSLDRAMELATSAFNAYALMLSENGGIRETKEVTGWLRLDSNGEEDDILFLGEEPLADQLKEFMVGRAVLVRYYTSAKEVTVEQAQTEFLNQLEGVGNASYDMRYSDVTGYLWTDEEIKVGGHDLLAELKSESGRYLILLVGLYGKV